MLLLYSVFFYDSQPMLVVDKYITNAEYDSSTFVLKVFPTLLVADLLAGLKRKILRNSGGLRRRGGLCNNYTVIGKGLLGSKFQNAVVCTKAHCNRHLIGSYLKSANQACSFNACNVFYIIYCQ